MSFGYNASPRPAIGNFCARVFRVEGRHPRHLRLHMLSSSAVPFDRRCIHTTLTFLLENLSRGEEDRGD